MCAVDAAQRHVKLPPLDLDRAEEMNVRDVHARRTRMERDEVRPSRILWEQDGARGAVDPHLQATGF